VLISPNFTETSAILKNTARPRKERRFEFKSPQKELRFGDLDDLDVLFRPSFHFETEFDF